MKALAVILALCCAVHADDGISREDIAATVRHMQAIVRAQAEDLAAAQAHVTEVEQANVAAAAERNAMAVRVEVAESLADSLKLRNAEMSTQNLKLKLLASALGLALTFAVWRLARA